MITLLDYSIISNNLLFSFSFTDGNGNNGSITSSVSTNTFVVNGVTCYKVVTSGTNVEGDPISFAIYAPTEEIENENGDINPTKLFNYIIDKAKKFLCPKCL